MAEASQSRDGNDLNIDGETSDDGDVSETSDLNIDGETFDDEDVDCEQVKTIEDVNKKVIKHAMSIYKVKNSKLDIPDKFVGTEEDLESKIEDQFKSKQKGELKWIYHKLAIDKCEAYNICLFTYQSKTENRVGPAIAIQRKAKQKHFKKGRRTGTVIVFHKIAGDNKPEIFFLCSGYAYSTILSFVDVDVRTEMIKSYLKDSNIKSIEYLSLSGPDVKTKLIFRTNIEHFFRQFDILGKIITNVSGEIEPDSDLAKCIKTHDTQHKAKTIRIDFGAYNVKFFRLLTCQAWTEVIELITKRMEHASKQVEHTQKSIINALESIQIVKDPTLSKDLNDQLNNRLIAAISNDEEITDLFLVSRRPEDFTLASSFTLKFKTEETSRKIKVWGSSPSVEEVINALHNDNHLELINSEVVKGNLERKRIVIAFGSPSRALPLQYLIHGSVANGNVSFFKLSTCWYRISPAYFERIERQFGLLAENAVLKNKNDTCFSLLDALKYTWSYESQYFTLHDIRTVFGITKDNAECLVNILSDSIRPCEGKTCLLTKNKNMYLLPSSKRAIVKLVDVISKALNDETEKREKTLKYIWGLSQNQTIKDTTAISLKQKFDVVKAEFENGSSKTKYQVKNPIISGDTEQKLSDKLHAVDITDLLSYLRSLLPLSEGEYNELYLHPHHKDVEVIPGDRVLVKNVELFDILIHDPNEKVTYLVHIKDGFDVHIRDVCSQIRVSANLFWMDYMGGTCTQAEGFWNAGTSEGVNTVYRIQLKERLKALGKEKLISYFDHDIKIIFVLGFRHKKNDFLRFSSPKQVRSTIAKIELLTLYADFAKYQVGGWRKFELKVLQLKSDNGSDNNPNPQAMKKRKQGEKAPRKIKQRKMTDYSQTDLPKE